MFVSAARRSEIGNAESTAFLAWVRECRPRLFLRHCYKLRGADSVFLASAALFAAELVTLDREQLQRGSSIVQTLSPGNFLKTAGTA